MFDMNDPTVRDRFAMLHDGERMIAAHPLTGVGPNMVQRLYVDFKGSDSLVGPDAVNQINPHLHNVPLQIAAERGLPALALWLWFIVALLRDSVAAVSRPDNACWRRRRWPRSSRCSTAGLFEYNFGDSEVLMLFLIARHAARGRRSSAFVMTLPPLDAGRARDLIARFAGLPVLVVGDVMLDRFIVGRVTRISPEAPVPVVQFESEHARLGGAANVAHNIAALGGRASLVGLVGADAAAATLRDQLERGRASTPTASSRIRARPTTEKVRIVTERNQQVARIDYEHDADAGGDVERAIVAQVARLGAGAKALLVSDYLKGAITRAVVRGAARAARGGRAAHRRSEDPAPGLLRRRDARHAEPSRSGGGDASPRPHRTRTRARRRATSGRARSARPC